MKLISAKILGEDFRSLQKDKVYQFGQSIFEDDKSLTVDVEPGISKIIFTGLNGSGKSNFLQFLAEAFSYLDGMNSPMNFRPTGGNFGFEIIYSIYLTRKIAELLGKPERPIVEQEQYVEVKVVKFVDSLRDERKGNRIIRADKDYTYEISFKKAKDEPFQRGEKNAYLLLPTKIIAYSSGHNEMLSNPFFRTKFRYFLEYEKNNGEKQFRDRLFYLDYATSQFVFIANMLLSPEEKIKQIKDKIDIVDLNRFRISINYNDYQNKSIILNEAIKKDIENLKLCASSHYQKNENKENYLILDFFVNDSTKSAFKFHFKTAYRLFSTFFQLHSLNIYSFKKDFRTHILNSPKWVIFADEIAKESPDKLPFRVERIEFDKVKSKEPFTTTRRYYRSLSDGEHQFLHLLGTIMLFEEGNVLYLFDEPETHFNPQWKYNYFSLLDSVSSIVDSEILMTTHDPVLIAGIKKEQLLMFKKLANGEVSISNPEKDLKGMGVDAILTSEIFGLNSTLDNVTFNEIIERRKLLIKQEKGHLNEEENQELNRLSEQLKDIDFNIPFADPLYKDFILALDNLDEYKRTDLTPEEIREREQFAKEVMQKLNEEGL